MAEETMAHGGSEAEDAYWADDAVGAIRERDAMRERVEALEALVSKMHADREAVWYWIREPDWADEFSFAKWMNARPIHQTAPLRPETAEREATARASVKRYSHD
ncbi:hypothetical protein [Aureimonas glaciei]|uniref:Uncharacterized protein n=1 Tax=Aureimonas glaciei TaxID=1776957 RepID=A0A916Y4I7_9HYPH|nr:hypothetical protein [Aureimonas glaciei]GGD30970.1 hypothetical protein GCM10011335_37510 [Aureimonas glaciei]